MDMLWQLYVQGVLFRDLWEVVWSWHYILTALCTSYLTKGHNDIAILLDRARKSRFCRIHVRTWLGKEYCPFAHCHTPILYLFCALWIKLFMYNLDILLWKQIVYCSVTIKSYNHFNWYGHKTNKISNYSRSKILCWIKFRN